MPSPLRGPGLPVKRMLERRFAQGGKMRKLILSPALLFIFSATVYSQVSIPQFEHHFLEGVYYFVGFENTLFEVDVDNKTYIVFELLKKESSDGYIWIKYHGKDQYPVLKAEREYLVIPGSKQLFLLTDVNRISMKFISNEMTFIDKIEATK